MTIISCNSLKSSRAKGIQLPFGLYNALLASFGKEKIIVFFHLGFVKLLNEPNSFNLGFNFSLNIIRIQEHSQHFQ